MGWVYNINMTKNTTDFSQAAKTTTDWSLNKDRDSARIAYNTATITYDSATTLYDGVLVSPIEDKDTTDFSFSSKVTTDTSQISKNTTDFTIPAKDTTDWEDQ